MLTSTCSKKESFGGGGAFRFGFGGVFVAVAAGVLPVSADVVGLFADIAHTIVIANKIAAAANARSPGCLRTKILVFCQKPLSCTAGGETVIDFSHTRGSGFL